MRQMIKIFLIGEIRRLAAGIISKKKKKLDLHCFISFCLRQGRCPAAIYDS